MVKLRNMNWVSDEFEDLESFEKLRDIEGYLIGARKQRDIE